MIRDDVGRLSMSGDGGGALPCSNEMHANDSPRAGRRMSASPRFLGWSLLRRDLSALVVPSASQRAFCDVVRSGKIAQVKAGLDATPALANSC